MDIKLIYTPGSNCSQRVQWALNYKGIPHTPLNSKELSAENLLQYSPFKKVPAIVVDGKALAESMAIIEFLDEQFVEPPLFPKDFYVRAKVREVCELVNGTIHGAQNSQVPKFYLGNPTEETVVDFRRRWLERWLPYLEKTLFLESQYAVGKTFSAADVFVIPIFAKLFSWGDSAKTFPAFMQHLNFCLSQEQIKKSCPKELLTSAGGC